MAPPHARPLIKLQIDLPVFLKPSLVQAISDAVWLKGAVTIRFAPRSVEVELRPRPDEAAAVCGELIGVVMQTFEVDTADVKAPIVGDSG